MCRGRRSFDDFTRYNYRQSYRISSSADGWPRLLVMGDLALLLMLKGDLN